MKSKRKGYIFRVRQFLSVVLVFLMLMCNFLPVYATEDSTNDETTEDTDEEVADSAEDDAEMLKQWTPSETRVKIIEAAAKAGMITGDWSSEQQAAFAQCIADIVLVLRSKEVSDSAIGGILLNMYAESHFDPYMIQGEMERQFVNFKFTQNGGVGLKTYDENMKIISESDVSDTTKVYSSIYTDDLSKPSHGGLGLTQSTGGRRTNLVQYGRQLKWGERATIKLEVLWNYVYSDENGHTGSATASEINIPNATMQTGYILESPFEGKNQWNAGKANLEKYGFEVMEWEDFLKCDKPVETCAKMFAVAFERPGDMDGIVNSGNRTQPERLEFMRTILDLSMNLADISTVGNMLGDEKDSMISALASSGYWSERDLGAYCSLAEINVEEEWLAEAQRAYLSNRDLYELGAWERNVESSRIEDYLINGGRRVVVFVGIIFVVWSLLIYLAYWFDRINNFIEIDLISILSGGRLRIADNLSQATFSLHKNDNKTKVKTVSHRDILFISILSITFGMLIISGRIFSILYWLFTRVDKLLNWIWWLITVWFR